MAKYPSTIPGFQNANGQRVIECTGWASESRAGQKVYRLRCVHCGHEYGANGIDILERKCPSHQGGRLGEKLRGERSVGLFDGEV